MSDHTAATTNPPPDAVRPTTAVPGQPHRRRVRLRFWLGLLAAAMASLVFSAPPWHAVVRFGLGWLASRQGCDLTLDAVEGGPFDTTHLYGLRCRQRGLPPPARANAATAAPGTDIRIAHAQFAFAWALPWQARPEAVWVRQLTFEGVRGQWDLAAAPRRTGSGAAGRFDRALARLGPLLSRLVPADFLLRAEDLTLRRNRYHLRALGLTLSGPADGAGVFLARVMEASSPGFEAALPRQHGQTLWNGNRLTLSDLDLGDGVHLARATLDGNRLDRSRLDWDGDLRALGGTVRVQGAINFSRERLALELGGACQLVTLGPLTRLLDIPGPADGRVEQASFSFRGDPEDWPAAEMWLAGRATDFRWGPRRWESLEIQAVVTNRRVQVHRLELRQSRNRLSLDGECALPPDAPTAGHWWQAGFACNVDARLEDLHDLAQLFGPRAPDLSGRMSVNGRLGASPGTEGYDGYLNVEGSNLTIRGAPLDFLRSTLVFHGEELTVADLQATRGGDYLAGKGSLHIAGAPDFQALGRVSIEDCGIYAPAVKGLLPWTADASAGPVRNLTAGVRLEGSVLHLDQCRGEQDGDTFGLTGRVDLREPAAPVLDLSLNGEQSPHAADPADADAGWHAGLSYALTLRGPLPGGVTIGGGIQLVHGRFDPPAAFTADPAAWGALEPRLLPPLVRRLPAAWRDWALGVHVTAESPLVVRAPGGREGQVTPDWKITGTGRHPLLGGTLKFHTTAGSEQEDGTWYFAAGQPGKTSLLATTSTDDGLRGIFQYGALDQPQTAPWELTVPNQTDVPTPASSGEATATP